MMDIKQAEELSKASLDSLKRIQAFAAISSRFSYGWAERAFSHGVPNLDGRRYRTFVEQIPAVIFMAFLDGASVKLMSVRTSSRSSVFRKRNGWMIPSVGTPDTPGR